jgi:DNA-binding NtrC family response regulator
MSKEKQYKTIEEMQIYYICKALRKTKGHREKAATLLGITPRTLYAKINLYQLK